MILAICGGLYFVDMSWFLSFGPILRSVLATAMLTLPVFFSGIIFVRTLNASPNPDQALGANMLGSLAGGILQSMTLITGLKVMFLVVGLFYLAAALSDPIRRKVWTD